MLIQIRRWLEPPTFAGDADKTAQARVFNALMLNLGLALLIAIFILVPLFVVNKVGAWALLLVLFSALLLGRALIFRGRFRLGNFLIITVAWLCFLLLALLSGGATSPAMFYLASVTLIAGFLLSRRLANGLTVLTILIALAITYLERVGLQLPTVFVFTPLTGWLAFGLGLAFMNSARGLFVRNLEGALVQARQQDAARQQAEAALRQSEERFRAQYKGIPLPTYTWRSAGDELALVDCNDAALAFTQGRIVGLIGQTASAIYRDDAATLNELLECRRAGVNRKTERWHRLASTGELKFIAINYAFVPPDLVMVHTEDITARQHTEEQLRVKDSALDSSLNAVTIADLQGRLTYVNPAFLSLWRYPDAQPVLGRPLISFWQRPEEAAAVLAALHTEGGWRGDLTAQRPDSSTFTAQVSASLVRDRAGQPLALLAAFTDITDRRLAENALRESQTRYQLIFDNSGTTNSIFDTECRLLLHNKLARALEAIPGEALGKTAEEIFGEQGPVVAERMRRVMASGVAEVFETAFDPPVGRRWFRSIYHPIYDDQRVLLGVQIVSQDITEYKRAEAALRESENKYRTLFETLSEGVALNEILYDDQGEMTDYRILEVNPAFFTTADYEGPVVGRRATELYRLSPDYIRSFWLQHKDQRSVQYTELISPISSRSFLIATSPFVDGKFVTSFFDITERKRAEAALRESEARFRAVVETANDAIVTMDPHGEIVSWNVAAEAIFGFASAEIIGQPVSRIAPERFRQGQMNGIVQALAHPGRLLTGKPIDTAGLSKDGREFPIELSLAEWQSQAGVFFTAVIRDISERRQRENELQAIATLSAALRAAPTRAEMLPVLVEQLSRLLNGDALSVEIIDPHTQESVTEAAHGAWKSVIGYRQPPGTGLNAVISQTRQPFLDNQVSTNLKLGVPGQLLEGIQAGAGVPLIAQDQLIGFLWIGRKQAIDQADVRLLTAVADIAANALHRATLHERTQQDAAELALAYDTTLEGWARALELRDQETEGHTRRVTQMTLDLARALGLGAAELENLRRGALLHDIGKMGIPDSVLLKPGTLNEREWELMRRHPEYAYELLKPIEYLRPALDIPYCHHEQWDGTGYPRGLKREQIPLVARIFAVVDVWDALTSDRPYRRAWARDAARAYVREQAGRHFDPAVVDAFLKMV